MSKYRKYNVFREDDNNQLVQVATLDFPMNFTHDEVRERAAKVVGRKPKELMVQATNHITELG